MEECNIKKYTKEEVNFIVKCPILKVDKKLPKYVVPKNGKGFIILSKEEEKRIKKEI